MNTETMKRDGSNLCDKNTKIKTRYLGWDKLSSEFRVKCDTIDQSVLCLLALTFFHLHKMTYDIVVY